MNSCSWRLRSGSTKERDRRSIRWRSFDGASAPIWLGRVLKVLKYNEYAALRVRVSPARTYVVNVTDVRGSRHVVEVQAEALVRDMVNCSQFGGLALKSRISF